MSNSPRVGSSQPAWLMLSLWSVFLFGLCLALFTQHARFPFFYHPDEPGKVEQVLTGKWNFHHPMLLLSATQLATKALRVERTEQRIAEAGRTVSAVFMALAVVALSLAVFCWRGWLAALAAGGALVLHHQLYELAHYMKEDAALLLGVALTVLGSFLFRQRPWRSLALFLGVACALAISGKYLGVITLAIAMPILWRLAPRRSSSFAWFLAGLLATLLVVNLPVLASWNDFRASFDREMKLVVEGQGEMTRSVPHTQYWNVFIDNTTPPIWALLLVFLAARWRERRTLTLAEWIVIAFPFAYAIALSFSPKSNDRYFLPATAIFTILAAVGVRDATRLLRVHAPSHILGLVFALLFVAGQLPSWWKYEYAFEHDDHAEAIAWVRAELPADAVIAKDNRVGLPEPKRPRVAAWHGSIPQRVLAKRYAADIAANTGTLQELRDMGVTHVAISESDYGKFFLKSLRSKKGEEELTQRRKSFYEQLLREGELLFERDRGTMIYLHPGIRIYRIGPPRA